MSWAAQSAQLLVLHGPELPTQMVEGPALRLALQVQVPSLQG
jgi:hypothetical protein